MHNIFDYIEQYQNCTFDIEKFNDVDNLILSRLAFIDFVNCNGETLQEVAEKIDNEIVRKQKSKVQKSTYRLLKAVAKAARFSEIKVSDFVNETDDIQYAFSAVTFNLNDGTNFIAFRGTDDSMASIYEDFAMSSEFPILSQAKALDYVKSQVLNNDKTFYLGGHSKGGNLALFSYVFANENIRNKIIRVYNNDGPGFPNKSVVLYSKDISFNKVKFIAPKDSIVGRLMFFDAQYTIVESRSHLMKQHNVFNWKLEGNKLKSTDEFSLTSDMLDNFLSTSLNSINSKELDKVNLYMNSLIDKFNLSYKQDIDFIVFSKILIFTLKNEEHLISRKMIESLLKAVGKGLVSSFHARHTTFRLNA